MLLLNEETFDYVVGGNDNNTDFPKFSPWKFVDSMDSPEGPDEP